MQDEDLSGPMLWGSAPPMSPFSMLPAGRNARNATPLYSLSTSLRETDGRNMTPTGAFLQPHGRSQPLSSEPAPVCCTATTISSRGLQAPSKARHEQIWSDAASLRGLTCHLKDLGTTRGPRASLHCGNNNRCDTSNWHRIHTRKHNQCSSGSRARLALPQFRERLGCHMRAHTACGVCGKTLKKSAVDWSRTLICTAGCKGAKHVQTVMRRKELLVIKRFDVNVGWQQHQGGDNEGIKSACEHL
jgi:hypothetical protein